MYANEKYDANINIVVQSRSDESIINRFGHLCDRNNFEFVINDIRNGIDTSKKYDQVYNLASYADPASYARDPIGTKEIIVQGAQSVLEYAQQNPNCQVFLASSMERYGKQPENGRNITEECLTGQLPEGDRANYPVGKIIADNMMKKAATQGINCKSGVFGFIFGATMKDADKEKPALFSNEMIYEAAQGNNLEMRSSGEIYRGWCHVNDAVGMMIVANSQGNSGELYNISNPNLACSMREYAIKAAEASGVEASFGAPPADIDKANPSDTSLNNSKLLEQTSYVTRKNNLEEVMKETITQIRIGLEKDKDKIIEKELQ